MKNNENNENNEKKSEKKNIKDKGPEEKTCEKDW